MLSGVAGLIVALATLITALGGVVAILIQNNRQHKENQAVSGSKIDQAVTILGQGHQTLREDFSKNAKESLERDKKMAHGISVLKGDSDILFGMIVGVDGQVAKLIKDRKPVTIDTVSQETIVTHAERQ